MKAQAGIHRVLEAQFLRHLVEQSASNAKPNIVGADDCVRVSPVGADQVHLLQAIPVVHIILIACVYAVLEFRRLVGVGQDRTNHFFSTASGEWLARVTSTLEHLLKREVCESVVDKIAAVACYNHSYGGDPLETSKPSHFFKRAFQIVQCGQRYGLAIVVEIVF